MANRFWKLATAVDPIIPDPSLQAWMTETLPKHPDKAACCVDAFVIEVPPLSLTVCKVSGGGWKRCAGPEPPAPSAGCLRRCLRIFNSRSRPFGTTGDPCGSLHTQNPERRKPHPRQQAWGRDTEVLGPLTHSVDRFSGTRRRVSEGRSPPQQTFGIRGGLSTGGRC